jgi:arsenate reductase
MSGVSGGHPPGQHYLLPGRVIGPGRTQIAPPQVHRAPLAGNPGRRNAARQPWPTQPVEARPMADVTIYHNPACTTSRKVLAAIRDAGAEPRVIEYLKTPPSRTELKSLLQRMGMTPRALLRKRGTPYEALGLGDANKTDDALLDAMLAHPVLIERPIVVTQRGVRLCRPPEKLMEILG